MRNPITKNLLSLCAAVTAMLIACGSALAAKPYDWQIWHQDAASPGMQRIIDFDWLTLYIIVPITIFVMILLAIVMIKFRASANPVPSKTTHHAGLEVAWTLAPVLILLVLAIPSFKLLTSQFNPPEEPSVTIKAIGIQWRWGYEYQGDKEVSFEANLIGRELASTDPTKDENGKTSADRAADELAQNGKSDTEQYPRLLAVDNEVVVPVGKVIRVLVTAEADGVIHNWAVPAFGMKMDAIPGRLNEVFFQPTKEGLYYGQCSELCGRDHAYMPIAVRVVSETQYAAWLDKAGSDIEGANKDLMASIETAKNIKVAANKAATK